MTVKRLFSGLFCCNRLKILSIHMNYDIIKHLNFSDNVVLFFVFFLSQGRCFDLIFGV